MQSEKILIQKSIAGDEEAFATLVHAHEQKIFRHCYQVIKDEQIAHDLTQETFLHAYHHLNTFRMEAQFYTWLYRIAHHLCLNCLKKKKPFEMELKEELLAEALPPQEEELSPFLQEAIAQLPEKQRTVIELYDIQKIPQKEIAARLNCPLGTIRSRLHYARLALRRKIKDK